MNEQEKTVLGLGVYTALADGEADQAEISFIRGVAREVLGGEDEDEFISIISGLLEAYGKAVEAGAVGSLISEEAEKLTDESWRLRALKFCVHIARQDGEFEEVEGHTIGRVMGTWASMGDGWVYSAKEAIDLALAVDETDGDEQTDDTGTETTEAAPKGKNAPVTAELIEKVTVTLSKNHKTFKTESGDYRLERYKDNKIRAFKDDEVCKNTKNVLRAINKEHKLGFTSGDFKKMHTTKLGKEIMEQMKTRK